MFKVILCLSLLFSGPLWAEEIWLGATTTLRDSGFLDYILPEYEAITGDEVVILAQSTGQILQTARDGNVDLVLTHHQAFEDAFIEEGYGKKREPVMASTYVLIGPKHDPAKLAGLDMDQAFLRAKGIEPVWITRGDDSGTAMREAEIWARNGLDVPAFSVETGQGMGASLNIAATLEGYIFAEIASFLQFQNKRNLEVLVREGEGLENVYAFTLMDDARFPKRNHQGAKRLVAFFRSPQGRELIENFEISGLAPFTPILGEGKNE